LAVLAGGGVAATPASAVIGGVAERRDDRPWVVPLAGVCTATLIAPDRLLTAGHCITHVRPGSTVVRIGAPRVDHRVAAVARHPRFGYLTDEFPAEPVRDVALVRLAEPVVGVTPLRVSRGTIRGGSRVRTFGFGTDDADRPGRFGRLRGGAVRVRTVGACRRLLDRAERGQGRLFRGTLMLCTQGDRRAADDDRPRTSGCHGDSGAPLLRRRGDGWVVVGVDSWGVACGARDGDPEVYVRIAREADWATSAEPGWSTVPIRAGLEAWAGGGSAVQARVGG